MVQILNNRYQVIKALSSGGFGETFLAEDTHLPSGRLCVIKQLKPINDGTQTYRLIQERFAREAAILEKLGQSNQQIPQLYAYFNEAGKFYLVQEWVEGRTLAELVQQTGVLKESTVIQILTSLVRTLEQVHKQGIIHRDIKPENIILRSEDCQPVLIDFGAVKETMQPVSSRSSTRSIVVGTPGFIPPEQLAGCPVFASDLYSLGLTAIYMLTGKNPEELGTNPYTGEINWRTVAPKMSSALTAIIERSLQSYAHERYTTAQEMLTALNTTSNSTAVAKLAHQSTAIVSPGNRERLSNSTTVLNSTQQISIPPSRHHHWYKSVIICSFMLVVPTILSFNPAKLEPSQSNRPATEPSPKSSSKSLAATRQKNLKKLLANKKCRRCDLSGVNLSHTNLSDADLTGANLSGAVLSSANLFQAQLQGSDLEKAKLNDANLYGARVNEADLQGADLSGTNLSKAYLSSANLGNTNLVNANLAMANLRFTNLSEANLSNANLQNSSLKKANLFKAQLTGANLTGAELCSSSKSSCANLDSAHLEGAVGLNYKDSKSDKS